MKKTIFLTLLLTVVFAGSANAVDELVLHMPYDNDPNDIIQSPYPACTPVGTLSYVEGVLNDAVSLSGAAYDSGIDYAYDFAATPPGYTFAVWAKYGQNGMNRAILSSGLFAAFDSSNGSGYVSLYFEGGRYIDGPVYVVGTWKHVVITHDGNVLRVYVDGMESMNSYSKYGDLGTSSFSTGGTISVGYVPGRADSEWPGDVDDLKIYDYAMDAAAVLALYASYSSEPAITDQPDSVTVTPDVGEDAAFFVGATNPNTGDGTGLRYKWYKEEVGDDTLMASIDEDGNWTLVDVVTSDEGIYYCIVEIIANGNTTESDHVSLTLLLSDQLYLHMPYDGDPDDDIRSIVGVPVGTVSYVTGMLNDAVSLNGIDNGIDYAVDMGSSGFTVAIWAKYGQDGMNRAIVSSGLFTAFDSSAGSCYVCVYIGSYYIYCPAFEVGTWKHLVFTYDGHVLSIYVDGVLAIDSVSKYGNMNLPVTGTCRRMACRWNVYFPRDQYSVCADGRQ